MISLKDILNEDVKDTKVICDSCGWSWNISDGGKYPYTCHKCGNDNTPISEDLRKWFGKGPTGGWDRYNSKGEKVGKCGDSKEGSAYAACLSNAKASKLGKDGRASFVKRKRAAQSDAGDSKKGGEQKKGQKPTFVKTGASEGLGEDWSQKYKNSINCNNPKGFSQKAHCASKKKNEAYDHTAPNVKDNPTIIPKNYIAKLPNNKTKLDAYLLKDGPYFIVQLIGRKTKQQIDAVKATSSKSILNYLTKKGYDLQPLRDAGILKSKNENMKLTVEQKMELFLERNCPTDPAKWSASKAAAKKKFDVYPSAYANGWAAKNYKGKGGGWKTCKD